jgi:mannose-6-phosphate isomerase-like protein (cupin superfamily)
MKNQNPTPFRSLRQDEYWLGERIYIRELMNAPDEPDMSLARFRVPPGTSTQLHKLTITEWYVMESGTGIVEIDGQQTRMQAGDNLKISPGQSQRVVNSGAEEMIFQSICTPRWTHDCYVNLEDEEE